MNHNTKINRVAKMGNWHKGTSTNSEIMNQIPAELFDLCPAWLIAKVGDSINSAYHAGRASTGAELIDGNSVWIPSINKMIEIEKDA